jgi:hypothetical protein
MVDSATSIPLPGVQFLVSWASGGDLGAGSQGPERYAQAITDSRGAATFCDLPHSFALEVSVLGPTGSRSHVMMVELKNIGITGRIVMGRINR